MLEDLTIDVGERGKSAQATVTCQVCHRQPFKYTCPRCEALYCSATCYRQHNGGKCVAQFEEDQVTEAVRSARVTAADKHRFEKQLAQMRAREQADEEDEGDERGESGVVSAGPLRRGRASSDKRADEDDQGDSYLFGMDDERHAHLAELAERGLLEESALTEEERRAFYSAVKRGVLAQYIEKWDPWWQKIETQRPEAPPPHCCCCAGKKVNPIVVNTLLQLLYAYGHCMRSFNGDINAVELQNACQHILVIAQALSAAEPPRSPLESLDQAVAATAAEPVRCTDMYFNALCLGDLRQLLSCREHVMRAIDEILSMLHDLLEMVVEVQEEEMAEQQQNQAKEGISKAQAEGDEAKKALKDRRRHLKRLSRHLQLSERKVLFLGSFVWHHWPEVTTMLPAVMAQVEAKQERMDQVVREVRAAQASRAAAVRQYAMDRRCDSIGSVSLSALPGRDDSESQTAAGSESTGP
ncbi:hit zinc finger protein [Cystoisospora suis]|uniref:Hit zinc finger protein n=1 Tax=Cystoisospora suis TaxID=483139 RepID=A0A2C6KZ24_9APIC|nr:hit zinc finger protein [Cystoisospora suis]